MTSNWRNDSACQDADPALFFPERGASTEPAKAICMTCPVFDPCWEAGLREKSGIWAGTSERERRRIRRRLGIVLPEIDDDDNPLTNLGDTA